MHIKLLESVRDRAGRTRNTRTSISNMMIYINEDLYVDDNPNQKRLQNNMIIMIVLMRTCLLMMNKFINNNHMINNQKKNLRQMMSFRKTIQCHQQTLNMGQHKVKKSTKVTMTEKRKYKLLLRVH